MLIRERDKGTARDENLFHQLHSKFGPIYRLRMLGRSAVDISQAFIVSAAFTFVGNSWQVWVATPETSKAVYRIEGKYPLRGIERRLTWVFKKLNLPLPMFTS